MVYQNKAESFDCSQLLFYNIEKGGFILHLIRSAVFSVKLPYYYIPTIIPNDYYIPMFHAQCVIKRGL